MIIAWNAMKIIALFAKINIFYLQLKKFAAKFVKFKNWVYFYTNSLIKGTSNNLTRKL